MENRKILKVILFVAISVLFRLIPHPPNFAPVGAMALFSGAYISGPLAFIFPLSIMFLSDIFLGLHITIPFVYGSFLVTVFVGRFLKNRKNAGRLIIAATSTSIVFFLITNFGVWLKSGMYTKDANGLLTAYLMGLPFFRNTLLSDFFYSFSFFYGFSFVEKFLNNLRYNHTNSTN